MKILPSPEVKVPTKEWILMRMEESILSPMGKDIGQGFGSIGGAIEEWIKIN